MKNTKVNKTAKNNPAKKDGKLTAAEIKELKKFNDDLWKRRKSLFKKLAYA